MNKFFGIIIIAVYALISSCIRHSSNNDLLLSDTSSVNLKIQHAISLVRKNPDSAIVCLHHTLRLSDSLDYTSGRGDSYEFLVAFL